MLFWYIIISAFLSISIIDEYFDELFTKPIEDGFDCFVIEMPDMSFLSWCVIKSIFNLFYTIGFLLETALLLLSCLLLGWIVTPFYYLIHFDKLNPINKLKKSFNEHNNKSKKKKGKKK